jgi:hypothetical protein
MVILMGKFGFRSGDVKVKSILSNEGNKVYFGGNTTRAEVLASTKGAILGSIYFSTAGKIYLKIAEAGSNTDWQKVTTSAAD